MSPFSQFHCTRICTISTHHFYHCSYLHHTAPRGYLCLHLRPQPAASPVSSGSATQRSGKKASFERNKPGLARSRKASAKKFEGNVNKRGLVNPKRDGVCVLLRLCCIWCAQLGSNFDPRYCPCHVHLTHLDDDAYVLICVSTGAGRRLELEQVCCRLPDFLSPWISHFPDHQPGYL